MEILMLGEKSTSEALTNASIVLVCRRISQSYRFLFPYGRPGDGLDMVWIWSGSPSHAQVCW